jgi:hypothetical protein
MTAGDEALAALDALLADTPPPATDIDPADLIAAAEAITAARQPSIERLRRALGDQPLPAAGAARLATLGERDARWLAALTGARHLLSQRLSAARRLRRSAR